MAAKDVGVTDSTSSSITLADADAADAAAAGGAADIGRPAAGRSVVPDGSSGGDSTGTGDDDDDGGRDDGRHRLRLVTRNGDDWFIVYLTPFIWHCRPCVFLCVCVGSDQRDRRGKSCRTA